MFNATLTVVLWLVDRAVVVVEHCVSTKTLTVPVFVNHRITQKQLADSITAKVLVKLPLWEFLKPAITVRKICGILHTVFQDIKAITEKVGISVTYSLLDLVAKKPEQYSQVVAALADLPVVDHAAGVAGVPAA
jgi:hypothetical protein